MNILLVNHYAGSPHLGMEFRPWYLGREWVRAGHRVRIVAADFSHVRARQPEPARGLRLESVDGIDYAWLGTPRYSGNGVGRIRNMVSFLSGLYLHAGRITDGFRPDVVITSSTYPLDTYPARRIARAHGARLVHEVHDLWPLSPIEIGGMSPWHPFVLVMQAGENAAYRRSDRVVSILPAAEAHMRAHGLAPGKFVAVPNGVDLAEWRGDPEPLPAAARDALRDFRTRYPFVVGFAGSHGPANALETFVDAAGLAAKFGAGFVLVGQGPRKDALRERAARAGLENVLFLDPVPKRAVPTLLATFDAAFIGLGRQGTFRFGVSPNKLFDYMMAERPVIFGIQEDVGNDLVREARCGISVLPDDPAAIAEAARKLSAMAPSEREAMGARGRQFVEANHTFDVLARRFLEAVAVTPART